MTFWEKMKVVFSNIWEFLAPFVKIFLSSAGQILATVAMQAVLDVQVSFSDADGDTKRKEAFERIKKELMARGIALASSVVYAAIEAAVAKLKAS